MMILARPPRPKPMFSSSPRAVLTAGMIAVLVATGGGAVATAQPSTTPAAPLTTAPQVLQQQAPAPVDPCATTTAPSSTTTAPPTTTTTVPATCTTVPSTPVVAPSAAPASPAPATTTATAPAPVPLPAPAPEFAPAQLPAEPGAVEPVAPTDDELSSKTAEPDPNYAPTENPNSTLVPGQMRSDREEVPAPFTKEDADRAEIAEARLRTSRAATACQIYWPSWFNVCGEIKAKYDSLGGPGSFLSYPSSGNIINPGNTGERVTFLNGPIYWSVAGGAHPVVNSFLNRWGIHGYEAGWLKYPTTDEIVLPDGGRRQEFQQGAIYVAFQNAIGSAIQNGPLRDKYNSLGGLAPGGTLLGYLTEDHKRSLPDGQGQMARFQDGVIYYHPVHGAHPITGSILDQWATTGYESGTVGYPVADERIYNPQNSDQKFERGVIASPRRIDDQYCGDICTDAVYKLFPDLRKVIPSGSDTSLTPCSQLPTEPGQAFCAPDDDTSSRRAPEPEGAANRAGTAIQPFCLQEGQNVWHTEAHYACGYNDDDGVVRDRQSRINVGELDYRHEYEMRLNPRKLDDNTLRSNLIVNRVEGEATNTLLTVTPQCAFGSCSFEPESQEQFIGGVGTNVLFDFKVSMDVPDTEPGGTQTAPLVRFDLNFSPGPNSDFVAGRTGNTETPQLRCDNYSYLTSFAGSGCVFAEVTPTLDFSTEKNLPEIAWHTQQAQASGLVGRNTPLHRATPDETRLTERYACVNGRIPSQTDKQCDEYPYKSSREGAQLAPIPRTFNPPCGFKQASAGAGPNGYSMCMVDASQNSSQGGTLNQFYGRYRVRIGDPFYVYASGTPSEPIPANGWNN